MRNTIIGIVGDLNRTNLTEEVIVQGFFPEPGRIEVDANYTMSSRLKLGLTFDNLLLYGTAGIAMASVEHRATNSDISLSVDFGDRMLWGTTFGVGLETTIKDNMSVFIEWRRTNLSAESFALFSNPPIVFAHELDLNYDQVQIGISWSFRG